MPCFARHSRSAVDLLEPAPGALVADVADLLLAELLALLEDPPHTASVRQAPRTHRATTGRVRSQLGDRGDACGWAYGVPPSRVVVLL